MKLEYYRDPDRNFGDDLNPWLWNKILPGILDDKADGILVGLGTILDNWFVKDLPKGTRKVVLGAGAGMEFPLLHLDRSWTFYGVRGPLTARYLGLDAAYALTDPAMCIGQWMEKAPNRQGVGVMPHHSSLAKWDWKGLCEEIGLVFLDPRRKPLETLAQLNGLEKVIAEAMHGAIVADSLRIPWIPLRINPWNYTGKWDDWASTLGLPVHFRVVPELYDPTARQPLVARLSWQARAALGRQAPRSPKRVVNFVKQELLKLAEGDDGQLSRDAALDDVVGRFMASADKLQADARVSGAFSSPLKGAAFK